MDVFKSFAKGEDPVLSSRLWIQQSVTVPLTPVTVEISVICERGLNVTGPGSSQVKSYPVDFVLKARASTS